MYDPALRCFMRIVFYDYIFFSFQVHLVSLSFKVPMKKKDAAHLKGFSK